MGKNRWIFRLPSRSRREIAQDVDRELAFHLETRVSELEAEGLDHESATRRAREEFGDLEHTRQYCQELDQKSLRAERTATWLGDWRLDLTYALRSLRRSPGFAAVSLLTLALAIGANTAIFSVARSVLLAPLPYGAPGALVGLFESPPGDPDDRVPLSPPNYVDYRARQRTLSGLAAYRDLNALTWQPDDGDPVVTSAVAVSPELFGILEVAPVHGRIFTTPGDTLRPEPEVLVSHEFWSRGLGADPASVGRALRLDGQPYRVVGVLPRRFLLRRAVDLYLPLDLSGALAAPVQARRQRYLDAIGRLAPGTTLEAARADLAAISQRLEVEHPEANTGQAALLLPLREVAAGNLRPALLLMQGAAALVLLIACANLANLTLSRATGRRREVALRAALGAGRGRLVRELLTESLLLGLIGGAAGLGLAFVATRAMLALNPNALPPPFRVTLDLGVLLFSLGLSVAAAVLFGLMPAVHAARPDLFDSLRESSRGSSGGPRGERIQRALVVAQVGLAVTLLIGAGLLVRSFDALTSVPLGFEPARVLTGQVTLGGSRYDTPEARTGFFDGAFAEIRRAPGVVAVGGGYPLPTRGPQFSTSLRIEGEPVDETNLPALAFVAIAGDYLGALGIPLLHGRTFDPTDLPAGPKTVLINETAARRYFPGGTAVGRRIRIGPDPQAPWMTIVGVVGDIRNEAPGIEPKPTLFMNHRQESWLPSLGIVVRTRGNPEAHAPALRAGLRAMDPTLGVSNLGSLDDLIGATLAPRRFALGLSSGFAGLALLLAAVGIYGVLAYAVSLRAREFGVRLALGATRARIVRLVLRQGLVWSLVGLGLGIAGAVAGGRLLRGMLYGVGPLDLATYVAVVVAFLVVIGVASVGPVARATRADPLESIRVE